MLIFELTYTVAHIIYLCLRNGLPTLATTQEIVDDLEASGFEVVDVFGK